MNPTRRGVLHAVLGIAALGAAGVASAPATATPAVPPIGDLLSLTAYRAHYRKLFKECGTDLDKKLQIALLLNNNYGLDALKFVVPPREAVMGMVTALQRHKRIRDHAGCH